MGKRNTSVLNGSDNKNKEKKMTYIVSIIIILAFIVFELRLFNLKRNRQLYKECFPLTQDKYCNLTEEESRYLYSLLRSRYLDTAKSGILICVNKNQSYIDSRDYFGLDKDNDYRCSLNDEDIMNNIYHINKLSKGIVPKLTGWRCSVVLKLITAILILCVINLISINIF